VVDCDPGGDMTSGNGEWMSVAQAAKLLEVSARTIQRSLADEDRRAQVWGAEGEGWRIKPLARRRIYQLRRSWVVRQAGQPSCGMPSSARPSPG